VPTKILLVDDSQTIRFMLSIAFKQYDCRVLHATNGAEALEVTVRELPDLIVMDLDMPVMDGAEALQHLKGDPALNAIPVIMLTASQEPADFDRLTQLGASGFLPKSCKPSELIATIQQHIELIPKQKTPPN
jgi:CheY-like chemotaxis protein